MMKTQEKSVVVHTYSEKKTSQMHDEQAGLRSDAC